MKNHKLSLVAAPPPIEKALNNVLGDGQVLLFCSEADKTQLLEKAKHFGPKLRINELEAPLNQIRVVLYHRYDLLPEDIQLHLIAAKASGVTVLSAMEYFDKRLRFTEIELLEPAYFMSGLGYLGSTSRRAVKRFSDLTSAAILLAVTAPLLLLTALLIKIDSQGPVLYRQERTGRSGHSFQVIKFRSMSTDAEQKGAQWASKNDARVTRVGRFIRLTRIDELPQLFNVLSGEMSLVGPRPERPVFIKELENEVKYYNFRHSVKPGITGYAQVSYPYGASIEDAQWKHRYDLYYIKHQSLMFDLKIMLMTVKTVLFGMGR